MTIGKQNIFKTEMTITKSKEMIIDEKQAEVEQSSTKKPDGEYIHFFLFLLLFESRRKKTNQCMVGAMNKHTNKTKKLFKFCV